MCNTYYVASFTETSVRYAMGIILLSLAVTNLLIALVKE